MIGLMRDSMSQLVAALNTDATLIENKARACYRLDHPSKQIIPPDTTFKLYVEPSGWSQSVGAGNLDLQFFFWIFIKCKPSTFGYSDEERLSFVLEYLTSLIHGKKWGRLNTYLSRGIINYRTASIKTNNREIRFDLASDEIGATLMFWQSLKTSQELSDADTGDDV